MKNLLRSTLKASKTFSPPKHVAKRVTELRRALTRYDDAYYNGASSLVSDKAYDALFRELRYYESSYPSLVHDSSPTENVGAPVTKGIPHLTPMLSLENAWDMSDITKFTDKVTGPYVCEMKYDGVAASLLYQDGKLTQGLTRGDGNAGEPILHSILEHVDNIPHTIASSIKGIIDVRGEVVISKGNYEKVKSESIRSPRNYVAGLLNRKHPIEHNSKEGSGDQPSPSLHFIGYALIIHTKLKGSSPYKTTTQWDCLSSLEKMGFQVCSEREVVQDGKGLEAVIQSRSSSQFKTDFGYFADGVVIKTDSLELQAKLGETSRLVGL